MTFNINRTRSVLSGAQCRSARSRRTRSCDGNRTLRLRPTNSTLASAQGATLFHDVRNIGSPLLVIFDKDGTLIDFHAMWGHWLTEVAERLEAALGAPVAGRLYQVMKYDPVSRKVSGGPLAGTTMESIRRLTAATLRDSGLAAQAVETALQAAWHLPDPVALAQPLTHLPTLFGQLHQRGAKVAVATIDDREPTQATFAGLGVASMIDAMACADDGLPLKPAPDMILFICQKLNISPAQTIMVGDSPQDLKMARAAGVGLAVGVSSGVTLAERLAPLADIVFPSIAELV